MKNIKYYPLLIALILTISSCSSLSKKECQHIDWFEKGKTDVLPLHGSEDFEVSNSFSWKEKLTDYKKTCGEFNIAVNDEEYKKGVQYAGSMLCMNNRSFHNEKWFGVGRDDAKNGERMNHFQEYLQKCSAFNINVDEDEYKRGYKIGIQEYCTFDGAVAAATANKGYLNTCKDYNEDVFKKGLDVGRRHFQAQLLQEKATQAKNNELSLVRSIDEKHHRINALKKDYLYFDSNYQKEMDELKSKIDDKESDIFKGSDLKTDEIKQLKAKLRELKRNRRYKKQELKNEIESERLQRKELKERLRFAKIESIRLEHLAYQAKFQANKYESEVRSTL